MDISSKNDEVKIDFPELSFEVSQSIKRLRANIQFSGSDIHTVAVTSTIAGEGKSFITMQIGRSFAELEKKTLILDTDIRRSRLKESSSLPTPKVKGLTEYLCKTCTSEEIIYPTQNSPYLDVIFTGFSAPNPSELVASKRFSDLLEELYDTYDYIIIDTPPVGAVIDGVVIAQHCDGTVLILEEGKTDRRQVINVKKQLDVANVHILGAILNKMGSPNNSSYRGAYYNSKYYMKHRYGYGYGYGQYDDTEKK